MQSRYVVTIIISIFSLISHADDFELVDRNNTAMNMAFNKARSNVNDFLKMVRERPAHISGYAAYLKFEDNGETEYLWLSDVKINDTKLLIGVIESEPRLVFNVQQGQTLTFKPSDIHDWEYFNTDTRKTYGSYTTCVLLEKDNKEDQQYIQARGLQCQP